jgi:hypothetical protein
LVFGFAVLPLNSLPQNKQMEDGFIEREKGGRDVATQSVNFLTPIL